MRWLVKSIILRALGLGRRALGFAESLSERLWELGTVLRPRRPSNGELTAMLRRNNAPGFTDYALSNWLRKTERVCFLPSPDSELINMLRTRWPDELARNRDAAECWLRGEHDVLNSGPVDCRRGRRGKGGRLDWRLDPTSGRRYPAVFSNWRWDPYRMGRGNQDMKGPWELSRMQHFPALGLAWFDTGDLRYATLYRDTVADFLGRNPPPNGIQWACTMDVGLRAVGMLVGLAYFRNSGVLGPQWWRLFLRGMVEHARFIADNLEYGTANRRVYTSNHYVANLLGLYWIALAFPALDAGAVWRGMAEDGLEREILRQMHPDGGNIESSVPYHALTLEMFLSAYAMSLHHEAPLSAAYRARLIAAFRWLRTVRQPGGRLPQVGDADSGRAHQFTSFTDRRYEDADHLLAAGARVLNIPELAMDLGERAEMEAVFWDTPVSVPAEMPPVTEAETFPDSGLAVLRGGPSYLLMSNGPVGTSGIGNHKHNDQLAVEWVIGDIPVLVDAGSYIYTADPEARNRFRATAMHNTVCVAQEEQNRFNPVWLFRMFQEGIPAITVPQVDTECVAVKGWHDAYTRLDPPVLHTRRVCVDRKNGQVTIDDYLDGGLGHSLRWSFLVHPALRVEVSGATAILSRGDRPVAVVRHTEPGLTWTVEPSFYSPRYGVRIEAHAIVLYSPASERDRLTLELVPLPGEADVA